MYRLLIVTGEQELQDRINGMQNWNRYNCKQPRIRTTFAEAIECMEKHPIDAIAIRSAEGEKELRAWLDAERPDMPIFSVVSGEDKQWEIIAELEMLLSRLNADDSNDAYDWDGKLARLRRKFVKRAISGLVPAGGDMERKALLYRMSSLVHTPGYLLKMSVPEDDSFIAERWHYGSDRLEVALYNFFGSHHSHTDFYVSVISPVEVRVLCMPEDTDHPVDPDAVTAYLKETIEQIEHYLGLQLKWENLWKVEGLVSFTGSNQNI